ncbi:transcriptional Coactivator p15-domain-containing protein [Obelidium mucronatum]|nr:transcriptional Coactivator p15-domain-containing protein [Obelidium mucronatum]
MTKRKEDNINDFINDNEDEDEEQPQKSAAASKKQKKQPSTAASEETVYNLSSKKRAKIGEYKGFKYADIREYYEEKGSGEWKPGKKGITLNKAELQELKKVIDTLIEGL